MEFNSSWESLAIESELALAALSGTPIMVDEVQPDDVEDRFQVTEKEQIVLSRIGQQFFRASVLSN